MEDLRTMVRFPKRTNISVKQGDLLENVKKERNTDVNVFSIENGMTIEAMVNIVNESRISAIFCADSEFENVLV
jgi:solute carrier family 12 sodium/potassium/chloride transporter 2